VTEHYTLSARSPERLVAQIRRLGLWARLGEDYGTVIVPADRKRLAQVWKALGGGPSHRPWEMLSEIDGNVAE
jgi:hypothetical protein